MPRMDGTGPLGNGPIGRRMGPCGDGFAAQQGAGWGMGRGRGFRRGGRFGWGVGAFSQPLLEEEKQLLEQQKNWLESQLTAIKQRIQGLVDNTKDE